MVELVHGIDGLVSVEEFTAADGSELAVARFESTEAIDAWREQPDHVRTRERGREELFAAYDITIATVHKQYGGRATASCNDHSRWDAAAGQPAVTGERATGARVTHPGEARCGTAGDRCSHPSRRHTSLGVLGAGRTRSRSRDVRRGRCQ